MPTFASTEEKGGIFEENLLKQRRKGFILSTDYGNK